MKIKIDCHHVISKIEIRISSDKDIFTLKRKARKMSKKLSEIKVGTTVIIDSFENDEILLKLMEMGCIPGEKITVDQIAPFKDPISIIVAGYRLSLRLNEAQYILVDEII